MPLDSSLAITIPHVRIMFTRKILRKNLRIAGNEVARVARSKIRSATGGGRLYYGPGGSIKYRPGTASMPYRASAPGQAPVSVTGTLAKHIKLRMSKKRSRDAVVLRAGDDDNNAFYAKMLEVGAKGGRPGQRNKRRRSQLYVSSGRVLAPRPFLSTALAERAPSIRTRLADAAIRDVVIERVRK
jgi:hypothetical protein